MTAVAVGRDHEPGSAAIEPVGRGPLALEPAVDLRAGVVVDVERAVPGLSPFTA